MKTASQSRFFLARSPCSSGASDPCLTKKDWICRITLTSSSNSKLSGVPSDVRNLRRTVNVCTTTLERCASRNQFLSLSFFLYACTPTIVIDGVPQRRPWGTHNIPLEPGMHNIRIYFHYLFMPTCGFNQINVVVQPNCIHRIKYEMGIF